jgi:protein ImuB
VTRLRLFPDQVVIDQGRQLGLWGEDLVPDRVARAVDRIRALTSEDSLTCEHDAVTRPILVGGRSPGERVARVPWGDVAVDSPHDGCWPGAIPDPAPPAVPAEPMAARLCDAAGERITVDGRAQISAPPALLTLGSAPLRVTHWAGPWPAQERWWDAARRRRRAYLQCVTDDGAAWLLALEAGAWHIAARY